jgi:uncharacterized protein (DUF1800 family)
MRPTKIIRRALFALVCFGSAALSAQTARLANISTRGQVGADANNLFGGFAISGGSKTVLVRAIGPGLAAFGVPGTLADPTLKIFDSKNIVVASNDNWNATDAATFTAVGAFPLPANSKDAVVVATLPPGSYSAQISGVGAANTGVALLEVYDVSGAGQLVNIATRLQVGTGANSAVAGFVVNPGAGTRKLLIRGIGPALTAFGVPGALPDPKLSVLDAAGTEIAAALANGAAPQLATATNQAGAFATGAADAAVIVNVSPGAYTVQLAGDARTSAGVALIEVYDISNSTGTPPAFAQTPRLFFTTIRPANVASTASGYATLLFDPNTATATVSVTFSNLTSTATGIHLVLGAAGGNPTFLFNLPRNQTFGAFWDIAPQGPFSINDIVAALLTGDLSLQIDTANFPAGEIRAAFAPTRGSVTFSPPAAPPALPAGTLTSPTQADAARFLTQATFGPTTASIAALMARGIPGWLDDQMALPMTSAVARMRADNAATPTPFNPSANGVQRAALPQHWYSAWWHLSVNAPDQLRQRVAFALSELLVVGKGDTDADYYNEIKGNYYDVLLRGAFGSYRQLLEDVSLNAAMGLWLTYLGNLPADPIKGTAPDENYAREVQQLFTIGLVQLQPDGTLKLDASAQPIPTYDQTAITETARIFTGWGYAVSSATLTDQTTFKQKRPPAPGLSIIADSSAWFQPMINYPAFHDAGTKRVVSLDQGPLAQARPTVIPGGQTGLQELRSFLDTLFAHPNIGPFVSRHLIQRLVTANPSPAYVYRVAQVFADDGTGARGNLGAVVRAILTDYEARSPAVVANLGSGKLKEPLIRLTTLFRAANFSAPNGQFLDSFYATPNALLFSPLLFPDSLSQAPLGSPTVFNFFSPTYAQPGAMAAAGLVSPEMQIVDSTFSILLPRVFQNCLYRDNSTLPQPPSGASPYVEGDYAAFLPNANNPTALIDQLDLLFCANQMTAAARTSLATLLQDLSTLPNVGATDIVKAAINLVLVCPDGATQR